ncbi:sulfotransferase [Magnetovibrio sp.]|uniref:sulfotransferase n=1 Tax=Magnetovibrio sp. TaxID=2024836 RepID=UPI002F95D505
MTKHASDETDFRRAAELQNSGDSAGAFALYRKLYPRHQKSPEFLIHMAICAVSLHKFEQARKLAQSILRLRPDAGSAYNVLGVVAMRENDLATAAKHFGDFVAHAPAHADARLNLAEALNKLNRAEQAAEHQRRACELAPTRADTFYLYATTLRALGRKDEAIRNFRRALELNPDYAGAWKMLAELRALAPADIPTMTAALERLSGHDEEQAKLHFALATQFDQNKVYDQAFKHLDAGNGLVRKALNYDVAKDEWLMSNIATTFDAGWMERFASKGLDSPRPIFIVGMPRSGTTLVEQILAGHSDVYAGDELSFLAEAITAHGEYPTAVRKWTQKTLHAIGKRYLSALDNLNADCPHVTDKMPSNFLYLGVIRAIFPNARILHCMRDPIDTCLGNYRQMFTVGQHFSYDQRDLARYFKAYQTLMEHWRSLFGAAILDVRYEDVVQAPEQQARRIVAHCGLDWQDGCIDLTASKRAVYTASAAQVRDGIHTEYLERWRPYAPHIQVLIDGLSA